MLHIIRLLLALPLSFALAAAAADPLEAGPDADDPPVRAGRLSLIEGSVALRQADAPEWQDAEVNWPLTSGDIVHTTPGSRAEIRVGSSVVHMDGSSEIELRQLADGPLQIRLDYGSLALRVRSTDPAAGMLIDTREGRARIERPGHYRVSAAPGSTALTTYHGELEFETDDSRAMVPDGQRVEVTFAGRTEYRWSGADRDDFFAWSLARDLRDDALEIPLHVPPEMTGAEELAEHGEWQESADYGPVWYPRGLAADWAPYREGRWIWVEPWGWTWLDDAPWGFAPFHYGRWVHVRGTWGWVPGTYVAHPVYAPALVVWIGDSDWSVGFSSGVRPAVGWFPLGPGEVFLPPFRASPIFVQRINVTHVTRVTRIVEVKKAPHRAHYAHRHDRHAVTVMPKDEFRHGRRVGRLALRDAPPGVQQVPLAGAVPGRQREGGSELRARSLRTEALRRQRLDDDVRRRAEPGSDPRRETRPARRDDDEAGRRQFERARRATPAERPAERPDRGAYDRDERRRMLPISPRANPDGNDRRGPETRTGRNSRRQQADPAPAAPPVVQRRDVGDARERAERFSSRPDRDDARTERRQAAPGGRVERPAGTPRRSPDHDAFRPPRQWDPAGREAGRAEREAARAGREAGRAEREAARAARDAGRATRQSARPGREAGRPPGEAARAGREARDIPREADRATREARQQATREADRAAREARQQATREAGRATREAQQQAAREARQAARASRDAARANVGASRERTPRAAPAPQAPGEGARRTSRRHDAPSGRGGSRSPEQMR